MRVEFIGGPVDGERRELSRIAPEYRIDEKRKETRRLYNLNPWPPPSYHAYRFDGEKGAYRYMGRRWGLT